MSEQGRRLENVRVLPRTQEIVSASGRGNVQLWRDVSPHLLRARLNEQERKGRVCALSEITRDPNRYGQYRVSVRVLKPAPRRAPRVVLALAGAMSALVGVSVMLYQVRYLIAGTIGLALCVWLMMKFATGHRVMCSGIHCEGCKG